MMPSRPARLPRRISHSTPPSTTYVRDYDDYDDHESSRGRRRGSAGDHHHRPHRRMRSADSGDEQSRGFRYGQSRRRGGSIDSEDDTYYDPRDHHSHRSRRGDGSVDSDENVDSDESAYRDEPRRQRSHRSRRRDRSIDSQDRYYHSGDEDESTLRRGRHRSIRHPIRGGYRSPSRSSSSSSSSSDGDFDRARDPSPKKPGRLRRIARSVSRLGCRRKPSVSSRSPSPSWSRSKSQQDRSRSLYSPTHSYSDFKGRSQSNPPPQDRHSSSIHNESNTPADIIYTAARTAFEAGAVAALKLRNDSSPLLGTKGGKIAAAAIGAAVVDTFIDRKHPKRKGGLRHTVMRQATQMAIGNLVLPAVVHADKRHGKGIPVQTSVRGKGAWPGKMRAGGMKTGGAGRMGGGRR